jgi:hypothetical protein
MALDDNTPDPVIDQNAAPVANPLASAPLAADPPVVVDPHVADETDWRVPLAGDDEKLRNFLGKYLTPAAMAADAKKTKDELLRRAGMKLPENPTDEEMAAFRKEQGIPDTAAGYLESLPDGLVVGDDDRPYVDQFIEAMHGVNAPKGAVDAALTAYYSIVDGQNQADLEADSEARFTAKAALEQEWGGDYKRNMNVVKGYLATLPEPIRDALDTARGADGATLGNNADIIKWVASLALQANPLATVVPGLGQTAVNQIQDEIDAIKKIMGTKAYTQDPSKAARFKELVEAQERMKAA